MAIAKTFEPLAYTSLTGTAATISFTNISSSYTHLCLIIMGKLDTTENVFRYRLNNDSTTDIYHGLTWGATNGTSNNWVPAGSESNAGLIGWLTSDTISMVELNLMNYTDTSMYKAMVGHGTYSGSRRAATVVGSVWKSTAAVTSISFLCDAGNFATNFSITMYGITKA